MVPKCRPLRRRPLRKMGHFVRAGTYNAMSGIRRTN